MTALPATDLALNRALRGAHRCALAVLAVCAGAIALSGGPEATSIGEGANRGFTYAAIGLAVASILMRRRPNAPIANPRTHAILSLVSLACAAGLGVLGVALALAGGARGTALAYALAGAIFSLRPPKPIATGTPADLS